MAILLASVITTVDAMTVGTRTTVIGLDTTILTIFLLLIGRKPGTRVVISLFNCVIAGVQ